VDHLFSICWSSDICNHLDALVATRRQLAEGRQVVCSVCGRAIDLERVAALPTTTRCVQCAA